MHWDENKHRQVRDELMNFLENNKNEEWTKWLGGRGNVEEYVKKYRKVGEWAEAKQLILAARRYNRNFVLFDPLSVTSRFVIYAADFNKVCEFDYVVVLGGYNYGLCLDKPGAQQGKGHVFHPIPRQALRHCLI